MQFLEYKILFISILSSRIRFSHFVIVDENSTSFRFATNVGELNVEISHPRSSELVFPQENVLGADSRIYLPKRVLAIE